MDNNLYAEVVERIWAQNRSVIINLTTGPGARYEPSQHDPAVPGPMTELLVPERRAEHVALVKPDIATLDLNTMIFGAEVYDQGVKTTKDLSKLKGKKIGVSGNGSINQYYMAKALISAGLDAWVHEQSLRHLYRLISNRLGIGQVSDMRYPNMEFMKQADPDSYWLLRHPAFPLNPPTRVFEDRYELVLGKHTLEIENRPGHTSSQTHVYLPREEVIFVGDNIFHQCKTWLQESDPWKWLGALDDLSSKDWTIIPGHGEPCTRRYVPEQKAAISASYRSAMPLCPITSTPGK
jgi:hypothetical protein